MSHFISNRILIVILKKFSFQDAVKCNLDISIQRLTHYRFYLHIIRLYYIQHVSAFVFQYPGKRKFFSSIFSKVNIQNFFHHKTPMITLINVVIYWEKEAHTTKKFSLKGRTSTYTLQQFTWMH